MRDTKTGLLTHFECIPSSQVGEYTGELMFCKVWKDDIRAYWNPGYNATSTWVAKRNPDDSWSVVAFVSSNTIPMGGIASYTEVVSGPICSHPYLSVPSPSLAGQTLPATINYKFYATLSFGPFTEQPYGDHTGPWTSKIKWVNVSTPVYTGQALVLEQFEGCKQADVDDPYTKACPHEVDYFAPNIGLVRLDSVWQNIVIDRIPF